MKMRVLIIGAGEAARMLVREVTTHARDTYDVVGLLDDDSAKQGTSLEGAAVLGTTSDLKEVVAREQVDSVIIAVPSAGRDFVRRVVSLCRDANVSFKIVPGLLEIIKGPVHLTQIRDVSPQDLLGRESVEFDEDVLSSELKGATILVTGAGGSIGSELCRQIGQFDLSRLVIVGRGENQIFSIEHELRALYPEVEIDAVIGDIRDAGSLQRTFTRYQPDFVYHAAAHKHVHYMEAFPEEAIKNNVLGTLNVIEASRATGVKRVVMLSTDKAVNPFGVMGATKRFAEYLMLDADHNSESTRFITVRFGNVLASRGSVVPLFVKQIQDGGPVTVSDENASRFFMSIKEACMLVVQASLMGKGGEIFILQMGKPIRIVELARDLIALHGLKVGVDIDIAVTGLRPGEKMHEALVGDGETTSPSAHEFILESRSGVPEGVDLAACIEEFRRLADGDNGKAIRDLLARAIPEANFDIDS